MNNIPSNTKTYLCALLEHKNESSPNDNVYVNLKEYRKRYFAEARSDLSTTGVIKSPLELKSKKGEKINLEKIAFGGRGKGLDTWKDKDGKEIKKPKTDTESGFWGDAIKYGIGPTSETGWGTISALSGAGFAGGFANMFGKVLQKAGGMGGAIGTVVGGLGGAVEDLTGTSYLKQQAAAFGPEYAANVVDGAGKPPITIYVPQAQASQSNWLYGLLGGRTR
jgi:hypothetical protein